MLDISQIKESILKLEWNLYEGSVNSTLFDFGINFKIFHREDKFHATGSRNGSICVDQKLPTLEEAKNVCQIYFENFILKAFEFENVGPIENKPNGQTMSVLTPYMGKVRFLGRNGYENQLKDALKKLKVGEIYTVENLNVGAWSSSVELKNVSGTWNTVMFENV